MRDWTSEPVLLPAAGAIAVLLVVTALAIPAPPPVYDFAAAEARANQATTDDASPASDTTTETEAVPPAPGAVNVGVFGGSTGVLLGAAMFDWATNVPDVRAVPAWSRHGCGFVTAGEYVGRDPRGNPERVRPGPDCDRWQENWFEATRQHHVQVALIVTGVWETTDWILDGSATPLAIDSPEFDLLVRTQITRAVDGLTAEGAHVVIAAAPNIGPGITGQARADRGLPDDHPLRVAIYNQILREIAEPRDDVAVIDYGSYIDSFPPEQSVAWLPDGIHPTDEAARRIWAEYLGPTLHDTIATSWPRPPAL